MPSSTTSPSTWWNTGRVRGVELVGAEHPARADARRSAARGSSMVRACTGEVWVRSTRWSLGRVDQNVSCMVRAGWSGPRLSASKLSHSASTSGPSATSQPIADEDVGDQLGMQW